MENANGKKKLKLRKYKLFKQKLILEQYLLTRGYYRGNPSCSKSVVEQINLKSSEEDIQEKKKEKRLCNQCTLETMEDECHFMCLRFKK